jgi:hypothetical protein
VTDSTAARGIAIRQTLLRGLIASFLQGLKRIQRNPIMPRRSN